MPVKAKITGVGVALPDKILTNFDLEKIVDTSDEWIRTRTGISERRILEKDSPLITSDLGAKACLHALKDASLTPADIDCIICGTCTPDFIFPSTACIIQKKIGAKNAAAFDISAACSGFIYGLSIADAFIQSGKYKNVLLVGAEVLSRVVDWNDRNICVLFGDGAGAAVVRATDSGSGILSCYTRSDGENNDILTLQAWGFPRYMKMNGAEVFKQAVRMMGDATLQTLKSAGLSVEDVGCFIAHQANVRIIQATAKYINLPMEKVVVNLDRYGNTSSASIPLALRDALDQNKIQEGTVVAMVAFGGGLTWGSAVMKW
jgi:3-oxoacyl-[acyl-carrier-protein] synthase-3